LQSGQDKYGQLLVLINAHDRSQVLSKGGIMAKEKEIQSAQRMADEADQEINGFLEQIQSLNMALGKAIASSRLAMEELKSLMRGNL